MKSIEKSNWIILSLIFSLLSIGNSFAQHMTMEKLKSTLSHKNYHPDIFEKFLESVNSMEYPPNISEHIPGEIISHDLIDGMFALNSVYWVKKNQLIPIDIIPEDENLLQKINKLFPEKSRFIYRKELWGFGHVREKRKDGYFIINNHVKSYNPRPYEPSDNTVTIDMEYITKDFKTFKLTRYKLRNDQEWINID